MAVGRDYKDNMKLDSQVLQGAQGDQVGQWGHVLLEGLEAPGKKFIARIERVSEIPVRTWHPIAKEGPQ